MPGASGNIHEQCPVQSLLITQSIIMSVYRADELRFACFWTRANCIIAVTIICLFNYSDKIMIITAKTTKISIINTFRNASHFVLTMTFLHAGVVKNIIIVNSTHSTRRRVVRQRHSSNVHQEHEEDGTQRCQCR